MPDQPTPPPPTDLASLRVEIDRIDDALHDLLMRRSDLVAHMASARLKGGAPTFRPGREALILRRLLQRNRGAMARAAIVRLWREIIAASLAQQGRFTIAVPDAGGADCVASRMARAHFGLLTPLKAYPTPFRALASVAGGETAVAVLPAPDEAEQPEPAWWMRMEAPGLRVVAALPFLAPPDARPQAYAVATLVPEPTGRDRSLLRIEPGPEHTRPRIAAILEAAGLPPRWLIRRESPSPMALAEVPGYLPDDEPRLSALPFPRLQILGTYAEPEPEE
ncbi:chorismate mutase [Teichococcus oryzae]|uniref:chorismate mutase n=1 Tax=Teichococcus oryzae TaxID=1608942 RepID=A0A5B2TIE2_9PROT|nr:chorismate mutase [Pseudoroseomonas oryzae]KAA2214241.1 chorismate mutase [Pseudoroseomonas oryzae]